MATQEVPEVIKATPPLVETPTPPVDTSVEQLERDVYTVRGDI